MYSTLRIFAFLAGVLLTVVGHLPAQFDHFISRRGDALMDGDRVFRFISFNIPNLHYLEDYLPFSETNPWRLPDEFEIRDALRTVRLLGGKVARMYVLSVKREDDAPGIIRHVEGPGLFNEEAFRALDKVLQVANEVGVRVIIPFVDNWHWWGGPKEYASFRRKERDAFWTDPELIADFKKTIEFLLTRVNSYTGVAYREEKAIMAWETGNELEPPFSWTKEIAAYVKCLDSNHLLIEGIHAKELSQEALDDPNIDILSTHHYGDPAVSLRHIVRNRSFARGKKPYFIGEYGLVPTQDILAITDTIIRQGLAGGLLWSLRFRNREGGFYHHYEYNRFAAYRWPGFPSGDFYDERVVLSMIRDRAYAIDGLLPPRLPVPEPPAFLPGTDVSSLSWQGSVAARSYIVERREEEDSSAWTIVAERVDEGRYQYRALFSDEDTEFGKRYFYRVRAENESGVSEPSNVVGPIEVRTKKLIDEMDSFEKIYQKDGDLMLLTYHDIRKAKEDRSRLAGREGSYLVYKVPGVLKGVKVEAFRAGTGGDLRIEVGGESETFEDLNGSATTFSMVKNDYGFFDGIAYTSDEHHRNARFVRIHLHDGMQVGRVEISFGPQELLRAE